MTIGKRWMRLGLGVLLAATTVGCASTRPIGRLMDDPGQFDGETVRVKGEVEQALGLPGPGIYRIDDGTGSIVVLSEEHGAPRTGAEVRVKGVFRSAMTLLDRSLAVLVEKERKLRR